MISKMHPHNGKKLTGRWMTSLAHIEVSACEALIPQILSLVAQKVIAASRDTAAYQWHHIGDAEGARLAFPSMPGVATGQVHSLAVDTEGSLVFGVLDSVLIGRVFRKALRLDNEATTSL